MCADHWQRLRDAIDSRLLTALVPESGQQAMANLADELQHGASVDNFDPLMGAHNAILVNAVTAAGPLMLEMMQPTADGTEHCPICWLNTWANDSWETYREYAGKPCPCPESCGQTVPLQPPTYDCWIDLAADGQVEAWKALKP